MPTREEFHAIATQTRRNETLNNMRREAEKRLTAARSILTVDERTHFLVTLFQEGLVPNESWVADHADRACKIPYQRGHDLRRAMCFATSHKYAINYLEQNPMLLASDRCRYYVSSVLDRSRFVTQVRETCEGGGRLRAVCRSMGIPLQLSKIHPKHLDSAPIIRLLGANVSASTLAQIIPDTEDEQHYFLNLMSYLEGVPTIIEWAAREISIITRAGGDFHILEAGLQELVDFIRITNYTPPNNLTLRGAFGRAIEWQDRRIREAREAREQIQQDVYTATFVREMPAVYDGWPLEFTDDLFPGAKLIALTTQEALRLEHQVMHHCVDTYWGEVARGKSVIYSIRTLEGKPIATVEFRCRQELTQSYHVHQIKGLCNTNVAQIWKDMAWYFVELRNEEKFKP